MCACVSSRRGPWEQWAGAVGYGVERLLTYHALEGCQSFNTTQDPEDAIIQTCAADRQRGEAPASTSRLTNRLAGSSHC